jgi:hypothetical protein
MQKHYEARFNELTQEKNWIIRRVEFSKELVFVNRKQSVTERKG